MRKVANNCHISTVTFMTAYLFWTRDVASICQDKAAEFVEVLYSPLFPLWGLQQHLCKKVKVIKTSSNNTKLLNELLKVLKVTLQSTHQRLRFARQQ